MHLLDNKVFLIQATRILIKPIDECFIPDFALAVSDMSVSVIFGTDLDASISA